MFASRAPTDGVLVAESYPKCSDLVLGREFLDRGGGCGVHTHAVSGSEKIQRVEHFVVGDLGFG